MKAVEATSEVFWTAFRSLPKKGRNAVLAKMLRDRDFVEDLMDAVVIEQRRKEPSRSLDDYLARRKKKSEVSDKEMGDIAARYGKPDKKSVRKETLDGGKRLYEAIRYPITD